MYLREGKTGGAEEMRSNSTNVNSVVSNTGRVPKES